MSKVVEVKIDRRRLDAQIARLMAAAAQLRRAAAGVERAGDRAARDIQAATRGR